MLVATRAGWLLGTFGARVVSELQDYRAPTTVGPSTTYIGISYSTFESYIPVCADLTQAISAPLYNAAPVVVRIRRNPEIELFYDQTDRLSSQACNRLCTSPGLPLHASE
jgi:hypothetical protein